MRTTFYVTFLACLIATCVILIASLFDFSFLPLIILVWIAFSVIILLIDLPVYLIEKYIKNK